MTLALIYCPTTPLGNWWLALLRHEWYTSSAQNDVMVPGIVEWPEQDTTPLTLVTRHPCYTSYKSRLLRNPSPTHTFDSTIHISVSEMRPSIPPDVNYIVQRLTDEEARHRCFSVFEPAQAMTFSIVDDWSPFLYCANIYLDTKTMCPIHMHAFLMLSVLTKPHWLPRVYVQAMRNLFSLSKLLHTQTV